MRAATSKLALGVAVATLFGVAGALGGPAAEDSDTGATECAALFEHQLDLASREDFPLAPSIRRGRRSLERFRKAQMDRCQKELSGAERQCQLAANTFAELMACKGAELGPEETEVPEEEVPGEKPTEKEETPQASYAVDRTNCTRAYEHMLDVIVKGEDFQSREDQKQLQEYWSRPDSKNSFVTNCLGNFKDGDLGCILGTRDVDVLQACLLVLD